MDTLDLIPQFLSLGIVPCAQVSDLSLLYVNEVGVGGVTATIQIGNLWKVLGFWCSVTFIQLKEMIMNHLTISACIEKGTQ